MRTKKTGHAARGLTPVQAVPAKAQARGSRYQGAMAMRYKLAATDDRVMATALHAFQGFMSNTYIIPSSGEHSEGEGHNADSLLHNVLLMLITRLTQHRLTELAEGYCQKLSGVRLVVMHTGDVFYHL